MVSATVYLAVYSRPMVSFTYIDLVDTVAATSPAHPEIVNGITRH